MKHAQRQERPTLAYSRAAANRLTLDLSTAPSVPSFLGARQVEVPIESLVPFIDWTFFFSAWEMKGRFPAILDDPAQGAAARELYGHAQALLAGIVRERSLTARGVYGFWPAASDGDDIVLWKDASCTERVHVQHTLRQQIARDVEDAKSFFSRQGGQPGLKT